MFVACATIEDSAGITKVSICTELHEEAGLDTAADADPLKLCCHANPPRPLVDAIFKVAATKSPPAKFTCNGVEYTLIQYSANKYELIYNDYRVKQAKAIRNLSKRRIDLYVYSDRCRCTRCFSEYGFDSIENIRAVIRLYDYGHKSVDVNIEYCKNCEQYFVDSPSLANYERTYGLLDVNKIHITGNETMPPLRPQYAEDSILSRYGYSTTLYMSDRRKILTRMLESGVTKQEILDTLARFIKQRGKRCPSAAKCWSNDSIFVNEYNIQAQSAILVSR